MDLSFNFNVLQGCIDFLNFIKYLGTLDKSGFIKKLSPSPALNKLIALSKQASPNGLIANPAILNSLTAPIISIFNSIVFNITEEQYENITTILTPANLQIAFGLLDMLKCLNIFDENLALEIMVDTNIQLFLTNITITNFSSLLNINTLLGFLGNVGIPVLQIEELFTNLVSLNLSAIDIPALTINMPNFGNYTSVIDLTFLNGLINLDNPMCSPILTNFFSTYNDLATNMTNFFNNTIEDFDFSGLENLALQYNSVIDNLSVDFDYFTDLSDQTFSLITDFETKFTEYTTNLGIDTSCAGALTDKLDGLKAFKDVLASQYIKPLQSQITGLKLNVGEIESALNTIKTLQLNIPNINC